MLNLCTPARLALWLLAICSFGLAGCGEAGPQRAAVEGRIVIGGQPIKSGRILFLPLPPTEGPATSVAVVDGAYRAERSAGPLIGHHRVEVEGALDLGFPIDDEQAFAARAAMPLVRQPVPPEFNLQSQITTEIRASELNRCDVTIPATVPSARN